MTPVAVQTREIVVWMASAALLLLLLYLNLLPALLAGLLVFTLVNSLTPLLDNRMLWGDGPRLLAVSIIAIAVIGLVVLLGVVATSVVGEYFGRLPALMHRMAEIIEQSRDQLPSWLLDYVPTDADQIQITLVEWLRGNAYIFQDAGIDIGRVFMHIIIGMVIGALLSLEKALAHTGGGPLTHEIAERSLRLSNSFRQVVFAQIWISGINATLTGLYLMLVLPLLGINLPFTKTMVALTFVVGLLPILGNLISNTVIFVVSLSHSLGVAIGALTYLVVIHKLEYFLNARIIGSQIRARAWEMLIAMLLLEAAFGITGLIAAPIYYAYMKSEFRDKGLI
jgi:predicted PurR-regulated permease PerM